MLTTSQNYTLDERETSLRFVFPHRDLDFSTFLVVLVGISFAAAVVTLLVTIIRNPLQILPGPAEYLPVICLNGLIALIVGIMLYVEISWRLIGQEFVEINRTGISIRHQIFGYKLTKNFSAKKIACVFSSRRKDNWLLAVIAYQELRFLAFKRGKIAFNSGKTLFGGTNTLRFALSLNPDETQQVIALIHQKFPQYRCPPGPTVWS